MTIVTGAEDPGKRLDAFLHNRLPESQPEAMNPVLQA
jgi:hypothetical protein